MRKKKAAIRRRRRILRLEKYACDPTIIIFTVHTRRQNNPINVKARGRLSSSGGQAGRGKKRIE